MMYSKLFSSLVHSSLWSEPDHIRLLFITLLALADRDGIIYGSRSGLERASMIDLDAAEECDPWIRLMGPDDDSSDLMRNPENEGRRIEEIPGGFRIINYTYYRSLRDAEDRKAQNREAQQRHREKVSPSKPLSATVSRRKPAQSLSLSDSLSACKNKRRPKDLSEAVQYAKTKGISESDAEAFFDSQEAGGWTRNGEALKDWQASLRSWKANRWLPSQKQFSNGSSGFSDRKKRKEQIQNALNAQFRGADKDKQGRAIYTDEEKSERSRLYSEMEKL